MSGRSPGAASIVAFVLMLAGGLLIGLWTAGSVLGSGHGPGSTLHGPWIAWHKAGNADADPYSLAAFARRGDIPMAPGEGLALFADRDSGGGRLRSACRYEIAGAMPQSRAWTLTAYRPDGRLIASPSGRTGFNSAEALVDGGAVSITLSSDPAPGNWMPLAGDGSLILTLRLYDTPLSAAGAAIDARRLPEIRRLGCP